MKEKNHNQRHTSHETCAEFQERLPELFESGEDLSNNEHLKECENCAALVRDLEYIAQQAKLLLPLHDPSPAVWENIQSAIRTDGGDATKHGEAPVKHG